MLPGLKYVLRLYLQQLYSFFFLNWCFTLLDIGSLNENGEALKVTKGFLGMLRGQMGETASLKKIC